MSKSTGRETLGFQTEVRQLLQLMIHSLYSNKEIFLRELISNASDAVDKLRFEALAEPELLGDQAELGVRVIHNKDAGTITVEDNGIGMSRDELVENLGTIARSGTAEFLSRMTGDEQKDARLIGQFGVGFYSAFIVADRVTVESRRAGLGEEAGVRWDSDGKGEFTVENTGIAARGTRVTLHLKPSESEFSEPLRLENLIHKYSDHIAFPVTLAGGEEEDRVVNAATALWTRSRSEISDEEYREFYKHLSHDFSDPLRWSHNRVEGKREYTSLLYLPANAPFDLWNREAPRGLKLYVQRVFIMDDAEQFLPLYLRFVKGVVDSSDLPLNVSRELLQQNPDLQAMRVALTRRVLDMLARMAAEEGRAIVVAANKWDLVRDPQASLTLIRERVEGRRSQIAGVPVVTLSALTGKGVEKLMPAVFQVYEKWQIRISTGELNRWLRAMTEYHPPPLGAHGRRQRTHARAPLPSGGRHDLRPLAAAGAAPARARDPRHRRIGHARRARGRIRDPERVHRHVQEGHGHDADALLQRVARPRDVRLA